MPADEKNFVWREVVLKIFQRRLQVRRPVCKQAERLFARHAGEIDLVITDVIMPGCGGPELLGRLQAKVPDLKVLYMSGYTERSAVQRAGIDHGQPFVQKPFTGAEFVRHVRDALDR